MLNASWHQCGRSERLCHGPQTSSNRSFRLRPPGVDDKDADWRLTASGANGVFSAQPWTSGIGCRPLCQPKLIDCKKVGAKHEVRWGAISAASHSSQIYSGALDRYAARAFGSDGSIGSKDGRSPQVSNLPTEYDLSMECAIIVITTTKSIPAPMRPTSRMRRGTNLLNGLRSYTYVHHRLKLFPIDECLMRACSLVTYRRFQAMP